MGLKKIVYLNGKFIPEKEALIPVQTPGFLFGIGLFETMRCFRGRFIHLDWHMHRISNATKLINLKFPGTIQDLENKIKSTVKLNQLQDAYVRLTLWESLNGTGIFVFAKKYHPFSTQQYKKGFSAGVSAFKQDEYSFFSRIKSTNRILFHLSLTQARKKGFDEAIILNQRGHICEGARSNIFFRAGKTLFTPALSNGCLSGITRRLTFNLARKKQINIYEGNFTLEDLGGSEEAFLTNSLMGIMPLTSLGKKPIANGKIGPISADFLKEYLLLLGK